MKLSVVILNYNVRYFLEPCIQSVQDALKGVDGEIIVADNNSPDDSCQMIQENFPDVVLLANKKNLGFAKANNKAIEIAQGEYVLILNPDTIVSDDTFHKILNFADAQKDFGALGVKLVDGNGLFLPESKRGIPTPKVSFDKLMGLTPHGKGKYYADNLTEDETGEVPILVGAFMLMKRAIYLDVGGLDERYFMYGEDIDLSYKVIKKGYKNYYFSDTSVIHYKGESTKKNVKYLKHFNDAMKIFYRDHFKLNPFYDLLMTMGIKMWYFMKYFEFKKSNKTIPSIVPKRVLYIGENQKLLENIKGKYSELFFESEVSNIRQHIKDLDIQEIIFDANNVSYKLIIEQMIALRRDYKLTFKIHPRNANYIFGSNNSISRGKVVHL